MCSLKEIPHLSCANKAGTKSAKLLPMANGVSSLQKGWKRSFWLGAFAFWFWDSRNRTYRTTARFFIALNPNDERKYGLVIPVIPVNVVGGTLKIWKIQRDLTWQTKKNGFLAAWQLLCCEAVEPSYELRKVTTCHYPDLTTVPQDNYCHVVFLRFYHPVDGSLLNALSRCWGIFETQWNCEYRDSSKWWYQCVTALRNPQVLRALNLLKSPVS